MTKSELIMSKLASIEGYVGAMTKRVGHAAGMATGLNAGRNAMNNLATKTQGAIEAAGRNVDKGSGFFGKMLHPGMAERNSKAIEAMKGVQANIQTTGERFKNVGDNSKGFVSHLSGLVEQRRGGIGKINHIDQSLDKALKTVQPGSAKQKTMQEMSSYVKDAKQGYHPIHKSVDLRNDGPSWGVPTKLNSGNNWI